MQARDFKALIALSMVLAGCERSGQHVESKASPMRSAANELSLRAPVAEAQEKIKRKDYQVYSAMGVGEYYPGIDQPIGKYVEGRYSSIMLEDTSDAIESDDHGVYVQAAERFASEFNREMISRMKELGLVPEPIEVHIGSDGFAIDGILYEGVDDVAKSIMKKTDDDTFRPIYVFDDDPKSDGAQKLFGRLVQSRYFNVLFK